MSKPPSILTHEAGQPSGTKTLFTLVVVGILIRGLLSGIEVGGVSIGEIPETLKALSSLGFASGAAFGWRLYVKREHDDE